MKLGIKRDSRKKRTIISALSAMLILSILALYLTLFHGSMFGWRPFPKNQNINSTSYEQPVSDNSSSSSSTEKEALITANSKVNGSSDQTPAPTVQSEGQKSTIEITITAANQNSSTLQIRSLLLVVTNSGTCTLTLTKDNTIITKVAQTQALSSSTTCQGFDIPLSELSAGSWTTNLEFENDTLIGSTSKSIIIK